MDKNKKYIHDDIRLVALALILFGFIVAVVLGETNEYGMISRSMVVIGVFLAFTYHFLFAKAVANKHKKKLRPKHFKTSFYVSLVPLLLALYAYFWSTNNYDSDSCKEDLCWVFPLIMSFFLGLIAVALLTLSMFTGNKALKSK